ncbi:MAG: metal-dependent hydrolase [Fuerstiella sp.]|nr:metal-dependent hydrolase [Fuerstiella sp.]
MAAYREHITVSGTLGIAYAFSAVFALGFSITQAAIAAILTWIAGMLPDMDSQSGKPVRELFGVTAALAPLLLLQHTNELGISDDRAMLFSLLLYGGVRYGGAAVLGKLTVHRGMFHSIPALVIAAEATFLSYHSPEIRVRLLMAMGVALGFMSHLVLDEMYSVQWDGVRIKLSRSAGSAVKFFGRDALPNGMALGLMMFLTYASLTSAGILKNPSAETAPEMLQLSETLDDAPAFRMADEPTDSVYR